MPFTIFTSRDAEDALHTWENQVKQKETHTSKTPWSIQHIVSHFFFLAMVYFLSSSRRIYKHSIQMAVISVEGSVGTADETGIRAFTGEFWDGDIGSKPWIYKRRYSRHPQNSPTYSHVFDFRIIILLSAVLHVHVYMYTTDYRTLTYMHIYTLTPISENFCIWKNKI